MLAGMRMYSDMLYVGSWPLADAASFAEGCGEDAVAAGRALLQLLIALLFCLHELQLGGQFCLELLDLRAEEPKLRHCGREVAVRATSGLRVQAEPWAERPGKRLQPNQPLVTCGSCLEEFPAWEVCRG
jgi:hypothetical protein